MTTYTIELPDRCPRCKRNLTSLAKGGGHYAELCVSAGGYGIADEVPHRAPVVIIAGTEVEKITVFGVLCKRCVDKENADLLRVNVAGRALLTVARDVLKMGKRAR